MWPMVLLAPLVLAAPQHVAPSNKTSVHLLLTTKITNREPPPHVKQPKYPVQVKEFTSTEHSKPPVESERRFDKKTSPVTSIIAQLTHMSDKSTNKSGAPTGRARVKDEENTAPVEKLPEPTLSTSETTAARKLPPLQRLIASSLRHNNKTVGDKKTSDEKSSVVLSRRFERITPPVPSRPHNKIIKNKETSNNYHMNKTTGEKSAKEPPMEALAARAHRNTGDIDKIKPLHNQKVTKRLLEELKKKRIVNNDYIEFKRSFRANTVPRQVPKRLLKELKKKRIVNNDYIEFKLSFRGNNVPRQVHKRNKLDPALETLLPNSQVSISSELVQPPRHKKMPQKVAKQQVTKQRMVTKQQMATKKVAKQHVAVVVSSSKARPRFSSASFPPRAARHQLVAFDPDLEPTPPRPTPHRFVIAHLTTPSAKELNKKQYKLQKLMKFIKKNEGLLKELIAEKRERSGGRSGPVVEDPMSRKEQAELAAALELVRQQDSQLGLVLRAIERRQDPEQLDLVLRAIEHRQDPEQLDLVLRAIEHRQDPEKLDLVHARGSYVAAMRMKGRVCQRNILNVEGPKYNRKGVSYKPEFDPEARMRQFAATREPKNVLPICCNCCEKSVLGCE